MKYNDDNIYEVVYLHAKYVKNQLTFIQKCGLYSNPNLVV